MAESPANSQPVSPMTDTNIPLPDRHTVAAYFNVKNCPELLAESLPKALWADEVIIADFSDNDRIWQLCATSFPQVKYVRSTIDDIFGRVKSIIPMVESDFILMIDSDEFYTEALAREIQEVLRRPCEYDGFHVPQIYHNMGVCFGRGAAWMRLFRKDRVNLPLKGSAHLMPTVMGKSATLKECYDHINNPKLGMVAVKHFRYEAMAAYRMTDDELRARCLENLGGWKLVGHFITRMIKINGRMLRDFLRHRKFGFAGLCHCYDNLFRSIAEDVCVTEEWKMRRGVVERGNRGYY